MALLDIEKAFDRVWVAGLVHKLITYNFNTTLIKLIHSYLTDRHFTVKLNNTHSQLKEIPAGIPQGSVLGPKLFVIYLSDLPTFAKTKTALYADDTAIYAHSFSAQVATKQLQIHINILQSYWDQWKIKINAAKTETIAFAKKQNNVKILTPLTVYSEKIKPSGPVKYLGVHLDSRLTYRTHITRTIIRAQYTIKNLYPLLVKNSSLTEKNKKLIYTSIIRPILTYAAPVWCSAADSNILLIQRIQNKCLRLITNNDKYTRITDLHEQTQLPYIREHINYTSQKFYKAQTYTNKIARQITKTRHHNTTLTLKHKLPYQTLPIFYEND